MKVSNCTRARATLLCELFCFSLAFRTQFCSTPDMRYVYFPLMLEQNHSLSSAFVKVFAIRSHMPRHYHASRAFCDIIKSWILVELVIYISATSACHYVTTWRRKPEKFMLGANSVESYFSTDLRVLCALHVLIPRINVNPRSFTSIRLLFYYRTKSAECEGVPCAKEAEVSVLGGARSRSWESSTCSTKGARNGESYSRSFP